VRGGREILCWGLAAAALGLLLGPGGAMAAAPPALPASLWGRVTLPDGAPAPEGWTVGARVAGVMAGEGVTRGYGGHTVYTLHVPADDPATAAREGGRAGEGVEMVLCGVVLGVGATWQGGTNTRLDLTVPEGTVCEATAPPAPSPAATSPPTQAPTEVIAAATAAAPPPAAPALPSPAATDVARDGATGVAPQGAVGGTALPTPDAGTPAPSPEDPARSGGLDGALLAALVGAVAAGSLLVGRLLGVRRG